MLSFMYRVEWYLSTCDELTQELFRDAKYLLKDRFDLVDTSQIQIKLNGNFIAATFIIQYATEDSVTEIVVKYILAINEQIKNMSGEIDWRPTETIPEDYHV